MTSDDVLRNGRPDLSPGIYRGLLKEVVDGDGTGLLGAHAAGATVLNVAAGAFRSAGLCRVDGTVYAYVRDGDTLTITPALIAAADDGDPVESLTPAGEPEETRVAVIDLDMDGDPEGDVRAIISGDLAGYYPLGDVAAGVLVAVRDTPYGYEVAGRPTDAPPPDITGATITGSTIRTAATGTRMEVSNDPSSGVLRFYPDDAAAAPGYINPYGPDSMDAVGIKFRTGAMPGETSGSIDFRSTSGIDPNPVFSLNNADFYAGKFSNFQLEATFQNGFTSFGVGHSSSFYSDGSAGGGTTGASLDDNGRLHRTVSSRRYKDNIVTVDDDTIDRLLDVRVVTFTRKDEARPEPLVYMGAIAEEVAELGLAPLVFHNAEGEVDGIHYDGLAAAALALAQRQQQQIVDLSTQLAALANRVATLEGTP